MKLPVIRSAVEFINDHSVDDINNAIALLEHLGEARGLSDTELEVIGELISNLCGAVEVASAVASGVSQKEALNGFMKRVMGSIDR